jgi:tetratricopeptide (TPR) repeat protein
MTKKKWIWLIVLCLVLYGSFRIVRIAKVGTYENIATLNYYKGNYDTAIKFYNKAIKKEMKKKDKDMGKVALWTKLTGICYSYFDYNKAIEYTNKALKIDLSIYGRDNINTITDYINLVNIEYTKNKNITKTIKDYNKILKMLSKIKHRDLDYYRKLAGVYRDLAGIYNVKKKYDIAIEYIKKALDLDMNKLQGKYFEIIEDYNSLGSLYINKTQEDIALIYLKKALSLANNMELTNKYKVVREIYKNINIANNRLKQKSKMLDDYKKDYQEEIKLVGGI